MSIEWYSADEMRGIAENAHHDQFLANNAGWMAKHLNMAFRKGQQFADRSLKEAVMALSTDCHRWSARPCPTCSRISGLVGEPFGCDFVRQQRQLSGE